MEVEYSDNTLGAASPYVDKGSTSIPVESGVMVLCHYFRSNFVPYLGSNLYEMTNIHTNPTLYEIDEPTSTNESQEPDPMHAQKIASPTNTTTTATATTSIPLTPQPKRHDNRIDFPTNSPSKRLFYTSSTTRSLEDRPKLDLSPFGEVAEFDLYLETGEMFYLQVEVIASQVPLWIHSVVPRFVHNAPLTP